MLLYPVCTVQWWTPSRHHWPICDYQQKKGCLWNARIRIWRQIIQLGYVKVMSLKHKMRFAKLLWTQSSVVFPLLPFPPCNVCGKCHGWQSLASACRQQHPAWESNRRNWRSLCSGSSGTSLGSLVQEVHLDNWSTVLDTYGLFGNQSGRARAACVVLCSKKLLECRGFGLGKVLSWQRLYKLRSDDKPTWGRLRWTNQEEKVAKALGELQASQLQTLVLKGNFKDFWHLIKWQHVLVEILLEILGISWGQYVLMQVLDKLTREVLSWTWYSQQRTGYKHRGWE